MKIGGQTMNSRMNKNDPQTNYYYYCSLVDIYD